MVLIISINLFWNLKHINHFLTQKYICLLRTYTWPFSPKYLNFKSRQNQPQSFLSIAISYGKSLYALILVEG